MNERALKMYTDSVDHVIAYDEADAVKVTEETTGMDDEHEPDRWEEVPLGNKLTVSYIDDSPPHDDTRTVRQWIERTGRGFLASTEY